MVEGAAKVPGKRDAPVEGGRFHLKESRGGCQHQDARRCNYEAGF